MDKELIIGNEYIFQISGVIETAILLNVVFGDICQLKDKDGNIYKILKKDIIK